MRNFFYVILIPFLMLTCKNQTKSTIDNEILTKEKSTLNNTDSVFKLAKKNLLGKWRRTSYPFDEIIFNETETKYIEGEGAENPAGFKKYELAKVCPYSTDDISKTSNQQYFIVYPEGEFCVKIEFDGSKLIYLLPADNTIVFERMK